jgi:nitrate reductase gamma subunit
MSGGELTLWVALPYACLTTFAVGHAWRLRTGKLTWTTRSTQLLERRLLLPGSLLFHFGLLAAIGGHILGILVPASWTDAVGISHDAYHWLSILAGGTAAIAVCLGLAILLYRRISNARVRATTLRSDLLMYPLLAFTIATGTLVTFWSNAIDEYPYRETVAPWFRGLFSLDPDPELLGGAPFVVQAHLVAAWLLFAIWPFTRLVHVWSVPLQYLARPPIAYRARVRRGPVSRRAPLP